MSLLEQLEQRCRRRRRKGLVLQLIGGFVTLIVIGILFVVLDPVYNNVQAFITGLFPSYTDPTVYNTLNISIALGIVGVVVAIVANIILSGMRRNPGEETY